jgi:hypothetical protein
MGEDIARDDIADLIRQFDAGDDGALGRLEARCRPALVRAANRYIRVRRINRAKIDIDEAINVALYALCRRRARGALHELADSQRVMRLLSKVVIRTIARAVNSSGATEGRGVTPVQGSRIANLGRHRNGKAAARAIRCRHVNLDRLPSPEPSASERLDAQEELDATLERSSRPMVREIVMMRVVGYTEREIAAQVGRSERTIRRCLTALYERYVAASGAR